MPVIITEVAIQADGTFAIELHNNGATSVDISGWRAGSGENGSYKFQPFPTGTVLNAGGFITMGHSSISGLDFSPNDSTFTAPMHNAVLFDSSLATLDVMGTRGTALSFDTTYQSSLTRTPNTDLFADHSGDWTPMAGFANNTLGAPCFLTDTMITTPEGERAVQDLQAGDLVLTADGRAVPVLWMGEQLVKKRIGMVPEGLEPVCIKAGALGNHCDLYVTADHGMIVDNMIINAGVLVNGDTITFVDYTIPYMVYHVETQAHEILLANGAPSESYLDGPSRSSFDNAASAPDRVIPEMDLPRISSSRLLPAALRAHSYRPLN